MFPEAQTLFSLTLFLGLSALLAWTGRHHRTRRPAVIREQQTENACAYLPFRIRSAWSQSASAVPSRRPPASQ